MSDSKRGLRLIGYLFACLCLSLAFTAGFGAHRLWYGLHANQSDRFEVFWEAWNQVERYFYSEVPTAQERTYGAIRGALGSLDDPYTVFIEPQPRELERDNMRGSFGSTAFKLFDKITHTRY